MSEIRSVLVHVDAGPHCSARVNAARRLADLIGADVTALYAVVPACVEMSLLFTAGIANQALLDFDAGRREKARQLVADAAAKPGAPIEWNQELDAPAYTLSRRAFYADLLVLGQHDRDHPDTGVPSDFVEVVLIDSGKPALIVPYIGLRAPVFGSVFVAWKENRESARALAAALPILRRAHTVQIAVDTAAEGHNDLLSRYLQHQGVPQARFHAMRAAAGSPTGEVMLSMAADFDADLMVMGCYSHTRGRELVLGGATRTVLRSMTLPVLMSH